VAVPNTIYSSLYGVGSDLYNTNATRTSSEHKKRSHGSNYELSDHCVETVALSNQHYFQMRGFHRVDATQKNAFQDAFVGYGDDLRGGMIHAIRTMPDEKVLPTNPGKGCACGDCLVFDKDTILRYQAQADEEEEKLRLKQQQEREKVEKKIARTKAREQKARDAAERKRKREERQEQRERDELQKAAEKKQRDKAKQDTEKQEAAGKKQRVKAKQETEKRKAAAKAGREERNPECSFCENTAPKARMLKCSKRRCKKISCASCHGLRGRQASGSRRAEWVCKDCLPKTASAGQSQHSSTRRSSQGAARQTSRRSAASGSSSGRSRSLSASREKLPLIFA
jgi:flagellar biosynthesis GTPase FlhF